MDRREFLRRALSLAPAALIVVPAITYFLPPRGGWIVGVGDGSATSFDWATALNADMIARFKEAMARMQADVMIFGTGALRFEGDGIRHVPLEQLRWLETYALEH